MTNLQSPQRRSVTARGILGLLLAIVVVGAFAGAGSAESAGTPRRGELHVTKDCAHFSGYAGDSCTITESNLHAIDVGTKVVYTSSAGATGMDSDLVLDGRAKNDAYGHVVIDFATGTGMVAFSGGTGRFRGFHAIVAVTYDGDDQLWHWDGTYSFTPPGHDK